MSESTVKFTAGQKLMWILLHGNKCKSGHVYSADRGAIAEFVAMRSLYHGQQDGGYPPECFSAHIPLKLNRIQQILVEMGYYQFVDDWILQKF